MVTFEAVMYEPPCSDTEFNALEETKAPGADESRLWRWWQARDALHRDYICGGARE